jgi:hypothetical protein
MKPHRIPAAVVAGRPGRVAVNVSIPRLVGRVYDLLPARERGRLLEHLLRPLGVLSLLTVAGGIFADIGFRNGWQDACVRPEDLPSVRASHVAALVDHVQMVSNEAVDALGRMVAASPTLAGTAAAGVLATALMWRAHARRPMPRGDAAPASAPDRSVPRADPAPERGVR